MISDVLCEAAEQIERYMRDPLYDRCYRELHSELLRLLLHMEQVRKLLDAPIVLGDFLPGPNGGGG